MDIAVMLLQMKIRAVKTKAMALPVEKAKVLEMAKALVEAAAASGTARR